MNNLKTREDDEQSSIADRKRQNQTGMEKESHRVGRGELKKEGGTSDPSTSTMEPQKQGGLGDPGWPKENAVPKANPGKSPGELNEGRPYPTPDIPAGDYPTENPGLQDDHDPDDLGQKLANNPKAEKSQREGPAAYAPHANEPTKPKEGR